MDVMEILTKVRIVFVAGIVSLCASCCLAQEIKTVEGIKGEWIISNDITPIQARANAIDQAKAEALRNAGATEYVSESSLLYKTEKDKKLEDIHKSLTSVDVSCMPVEQLPQRGA